MIPTVLSPCSHGRLRPHVYDCPRCPVGNRVHCCSPVAPDGLLVVVERDEHGDPVVAALRHRDWPGSSAELCRCGSVILETLEGWAHPDPVAEAGCLDTRPMEDPPS